MDGNDAELKAIVAPHLEKTGGLITALRAVQDAMGCVPVDGDATIAEMFNITRAELRGVVSFYADFSREPKGETVVRLCVAEACQAAGARTLVRAVEKKCAVKLGETSASNDLTVEPVYCLGLCSCAPAAMVHGRLVGFANPEKITAEIERASKGSAQ